MFFCILEQQQALLITLNHQFAGNLILLLKMLVQMTGRKEWTQSEKWKLLKLSKDWVYIKRWRSDS